MSEIRFLVRLEERHAFLKLKASVVVIDPNGRIRNPDLESGLAGLYATAQLDGPIVRRLAKPDFYGHTVEYRDMHSVRLADAERMVRLLRTIQRRLDRLGERFGCAPDTPGFLARVADALKVSETACFGRTVGPAHALYDDNTYRWMDPDGVRLWLDEAVSEWSGRNGLKYDPE